MTLNATVTTIERVLYATARDSWGGATINLGTGEPYSGPRDVYMCAVGTTIEIPEDADFETFQAAFENSLWQNVGHTTYIGIFHDDDKGTIDFDGVEVVNTTDEVDALHRIRPCRGGAFNPATGNGYYPKDNA